MSVEFYCGVLGLFAIPFLAWCISADRSSVMWKTVITGLLIQLGLGVLVMLTGPGQHFFSVMNDVVVGLLEFSDKGSRFLFGRLVDSSLGVLEDSQFNRGATFAFSVLPTIIFFSALMSIFYYTGLMQKIVEFVAWVMMKLLGTSGAETLSVSSNIFVGQTEAPLVVKPFIEDMTKSELNTIMTGGFATVAGGVMAAYVGMLYDVFPGIAGHLMTASIMSAPAAIVMSKLTFPETDEPETMGTLENTSVGEDSNNVIEAAASGAKTGLQLALNVGAMLLAFIALVHLGNFVFGWIGDKIYALMTGYTGLKAFGWGFVVGAAFMVFTIARSAWQGEDTKFWVGGIVLIALLPTMGYYLTPWPVVAAVIGLILGVSATLTWQVQHVERWIGSFGAFLGGAVVLGLVTWLIGGSNSSPLAALFSGGLLALVCSLFLYWKNPGVTSGLQVGAITVGVGLLSMAVVSGYQIDILTVLQELTLQKLFGYAFSGLALLMGVPWEDLVHFGQLIGNKVVVNEFVAFLEFERMATNDLISARSMVIASYALCGFANFSSIAIQIGGIGGIAPNRESDLAQLGLRAMVSGALASFQTATVAGVMFAIADKIGIDLVNIGANL